MSRVVFTSEISTQSSCKITATTTSCTSMIVLLTRQVNLSKSTWKKGTSLKNTSKSSSTKRTRKLCTTSIWASTSTANQVRLWPLLMVTTLSSAGTFWLCSMQFIRETRQPWHTVTSSLSTTTIEPNWDSVMTSTKTCSNRILSGTLGIYQAPIWWHSTATCSRKSKYLIWHTQMEHSLIMHMIEQYWHLYWKWHTQESVW